MKFLFIILALASGWYCQAQETILKGHIRNYNGEEIFILCRETEFQDTLQVDASKDNNASNPIRKYLIISSFICYLSYLVQLIRHIEDRKDGYT